MELVGRSAKKRFPGFGTFSGVVESYDPDAGYFRVLCENGDSEELEYQEVASLDADEGASPQAVRVRRSRGRPLKKRRMLISAAAVLNAGLIGEAGRSTEPQDASSRRSTRRVVAAALYRPDYSRSYMKNESIFPNCTFSRNDFDMAAEDSKPELPSSSSDLDFQGLPSL